MNVSSWRVPSNYSTILAFFKKVAMIKKLLTQSFLVLSCTVFPWFVLAEESQPSFQNEFRNDFYVDLSYGTADPDISLGESSATIDLSDFDSNNYHRLLMGYLLTDMPSLDLGIELFYADYGTSEGNITNSSDTVTVSGTALTPTSYSEHSVELQSIGFGFGAREELNHSIAVNARIGMHYWQNRTETLFADSGVGLVDGTLTLVTIPDEQFEDEETGRSNYWGVGIGYQFNKKISANLDFTRYKFTALDSTAYYKTYSLGVSYLWD
jgi:hypothetical protein